jgi:hypothetical protein
MSTVKYHASSGIRHYYQVKEALAELGIRHGPFQRGIKNIHQSTHFYDLYDSEAMPFLILKLADTDFSLMESISTN